MPLGVIKMNLILPDMTCVGVASHDLLNRCPDPYLPSVLVTGCVAVTKVVHNLEHLSTYLSTL